MTRSTLAPDEHGLQAAVARGSAAKAWLIASGEVVPASTLAARWRVTPRSLGAAARRGELSSIVIQRRRYYPKEFLELDPDTVQTVSKALSSVSPASALVFWKRLHGALDGATVTAALCNASDANRRERVEGLARSWVSQSVAAAESAMDAMDSKLARVGER